MKRYVALIEWSEPIEMEFEFEAESMSKAGLKIRTMLQKGEIESPTPVHKRWRIAYISEDFK